MSQERDDDGGPAFPTTAAQIEAGVYPASEVTMAMYLADPCPVPSLSSGAAHTLITRSPLHAWQRHPRFGASPENDPDTDPDSDAATVGQIAHDLLVGGNGKICVIDPELYRSEPKRKGEEGSIPKGWTNNAIRSARDEALTNGLLPVLPKQMAAAKRMESVARQFLSSSELSGALDDGQGENTIIAQFGETWIRTRPDWMNFDQKVLLHYKTTKASANPESFIRGLLPNMGYDVALAFYRLALETVADDADWEHVILVQEQTAPWACSLVSLSPAMWAIADDKVARAIALWSRCMASGRWPGYSGMVAYADPTPWQLANAESAALEDQA